MEVNKQIDEMVDVLRFCKDTPVEECHTKKSCNHCLAEQIYNAGYRKQVYGEWLERTGERGAGSEVSCGSVYSYTYYICSICNGYSERKTNYCPHCGARMKGGKSDA